MSTNNSSFNSNKNPETTNWAEHSSAGDLSTGRRFKATQLVPLTVRFLSNASLAYYGFAKPGTTTSDAFWRIMREDSGGTFLDFADGDDLFDNIWDNVESLNYL